MSILIPPPLAASDWTFRVTKIETEEVSLPWHGVDGWPSWQSGRTFAVVQMTAETMDACAIPERDLIGKGFVLHGLQHRILRVLDTIPLKVRTQAWPVDVEFALLSDGNLRLHLPGDEDVTRDPSDCPPAA